MTLTILRGLPAAGKTTLAEKLLRERGNTVRVNRDLLRTMLHLDRWAGPLEKVTRETARLLVRHFLDNRRHVVLDETSLNHSTLQGWMDLGKECDAKVEVIDVDTPFEECLRRDRIREKRVGDHVIVGMAMQHGLYPAPKNGIVICDLDGTLCDISHRRHFVDGTDGEKKNWKGFFEALSGDSERREVVDILLAHQDAGREIFFVSGRPDTYRRQTEEWIEGQPYASCIRYRALFMRKGHDSRDDTIIKREIYDAYFKAFDVVEVIDDRPRLVRMWRELGLNVVDVGDGVEF